VTVAAPDAVDELSVTEATPAASVSAVPVEGSKTPNVEAVEKAMTAPTIGLPREVLNVAFTLAGLPKAMPVRAAALFTSVKVNTNVAGPVSGSEELDTAPLPHPPSIVASEINSVKPASRFTMSLNPREKSLID